MKSKHITDEILQAYLLNEIQDDNIIIHLSECSSCQEKLDEYQFIIDNVQKIKPETFSFDVTNLAMNNIILYEKKKSNKNELIYWGFLTILFSFIASFAIPYIPQLLSIFNAKSFYTTLLAIGAGIFTLFFLLLDIIQQYKKKEEKLFKNNLQPIL